MTVITIVAVVIFIISCVIIYHNSNSFDTKSRVVFIIIGMLVMYIITSIICSIAIRNIENKEILKEVLKVVKMIFTPVNGMIGLSFLGNTFSKAKDKTISTEKAGRRLIGIFIIFAIILVFETNYIGNFIKEILP